MKKTLTRKEIRLLLGVLDPIEYDTYHNLWEHIDKEESNVLQKKLLKMLAD